MKKDSTLISVIVPVYNVEKYVARCLDSIINQTYKNLEIIVVNDGSTDKSLDILKRYEMNDDRIVLLNKTNGGLSSARNVGIENAHGSHIMFLDSDDFISLDMIEILYKNMIESGKKIAIANRFNYYEDGSTKTRFPDNNELLIMDKNESLINLMSLKNFDMSAWGKLYDSSLFTNIRFPIGKLSEDYYVMYLLFDLADGVVYNSKPMLYYLQQRKGSITRNSDLILDYIYAARNQMNYIFNKYPNLEVYSKSAYCLSYFTVYNKSIINGGKIKKQFLDEMKIEVNKYKTYVFKNIHISKSKKLQLVLFCQFYFIYNTLIKIYKRVGE